MHYFFLFTKGERIVNASSTFAAVTGIPSETIVGQNVAEFLSLGSVERDLIVQRRHGTANLHFATKDTCALLVEVFFEPIDSGMLILCLPRSMKQRHSPLSLTIWTSYNEIKSPLYQNRMKRGAASAPPTSKRPPKSEKRPDMSAYCAPSTAQRQHQFLEPTSKKNENDSFA